MKLISTKNKLILQDFRHVFTGEKNESLHGFTFHSSLPGNITLNVFIYLI